MIVVRARGAVRSVVGGTQHGDHEPVVLMKSLRVMATGVAEAADGRASLTCCRGGGGPGVSGLLPRPMIVVSVP